MHSEYFVSLIFYEKFEHSFCFLRFGLIGLFHCATRFALIELRIRITIREYGTGRFAPLVGTARVQLTLIFCFLGHDTTSSTGNDNDNDTKTTTMWTIRRHAQQVAKFELDEVERQREFGEDNGHDVLRTRPCDERTRSFYGIEISVRNFESFFATCCLISCCTCQRDEWILLCIQSREYPTCTLQVIINTRGIEQGILELCIFSS